MKFRNLETGEIFNTIFVARGKFCYGKWCADCLLPSTIKPELLPDDSGGCYEFCMKHPIEAARLIGYEVIPEPGDDTISLDTIVETFNQIGKEVNMDKPRICEVLGVEVEEEFTYDFGKNQVNRGTFKIGADGKRYYKNGIDTWHLCYSEEDLSVIINHPDRIIRKPHFTEQEVEKAKAIRLIYPTAYRLEEANPLIRVWDKEGKLLSHVDTALFLSIRPGQSYTLDEIIRGAE